MRKARRALETTLTLLALSLLPTGCVKASFSDPRVTEGERRDLWLHRYFYGLIGSRELDTRRYCAHGVAEIRVFESGWSISLSILTLGVYTPAAARITCGVGTKSAPALARFISEKERW